MFAAFLVLAVPDAAFGQPAPAFATPSLDAPSPATTNVAAPAHPDAMAIQPDPHDFVTRADASLFALGNPLRFAGVNISALALRPRPQGVQIPTEYETTDLIDTVDALGASMVRPVSLDISAGCAECLLPAPGILNPDALRRMDHLLKQARDAGLRLFIPLAGGGATCPAQPDPVRDTACIFARWHNLPPSAFFTDPAVRADFAAAVTALLKHLNSETDIAYRNDPVVAAWENCDGCGGGIDPAMLADWTEFLGRAIKTVDTRHLYENGAFAGRLASVGAARLALPSVDILGDRLLFQPGAGPDRFAAALNAVTGAGRIYVIDAYDWTDATFPTPGDLRDFHDEASRERRLSGAFLSDLSGHAQAGGYLPPPPDELPPLYFPGFAIAGMDQDAVRARARWVRRFSFRMLDLASPSYLQPEAPQIIAVTHGKVTWRGSAGSADYSIERSADPTAVGSWQAVCDRCVTDLVPAWQDPDVPAMPVWYRMVPYNFNGHIGMTSDPVANR
jgi:hypothetical protein